MKKSLLFLLLLVSFALVFVTCDKDDDDGPAYVGTWESEYYNDEFQMNMKEELVLTENTFQNIISINPQGTIWMEYYGMKGTAVVDGEDAVITFTEMAKVGTSGLVWYTPEDEEFEDLLYEVMQGYSEVDAKIQVVGNTLTLSIDFDDDGTFSTNEIKIYTKV